MKNTPLLLTVLSFILLIMISCSLPGVLAPAPANAAKPTFLPTLQLPPTQHLQKATNTPKPTSPPAPTLQAVVSTLSAPNPTLTAMPCDRAALVAIVKAPDGTSFHPGDPVVRTWQVKNTGSCTWTTDYQLVFAKGYDFLSVRSIHLAQTVAPGETANITLTFPAPEMLGTYQSTWNLQDPSGMLFGVGPNGGVPLNISIVITPKPMK